MDVKDLEKSYNHCGIFKFNWTSRHATNLFSIKQGSHYEWNTGQSSFGKKMIRFKRLHGLGVMIFRRQRQRHLSRECNFAFLQPCLDYSFGSLNVYQLHWNSRYELFTDGEKKRLKIYVAKC